MENKIEYNKKYYKKNKDKIIQQVKKYADKNKEKIAKYQKEYRENHKEDHKSKMKDYYQKNRKRLLKQAKVYEKKHLREKSEYDKIRYEIHKKQNKEQSKQNRYSTNNYCSCGQLITNDSLRCYSCARKEQYKNPENHPNWQGGISKLPYASEWTDNLKESIRKRDNYECQNCGMTEEEHLIVQGQVLHIHHIDYNKQNCKEDNLIAVCLSCNVRANFNRGFWTEFYNNKIKEINQCKK